MLFVGKVENALYLGRLIHESPSVEKALEVSASLEHTNNITSEIPIPKKGNNSHNTLTH